MGRAGQPAEPFYTTAEAPNSRCVACHALSRAGTRMAITLDGGNGAATILDIATREPLFPLDGSFRWNFASFVPDNELIVAASYGVLTVRSTIDGSVVGTVPTGGYATHPDVSPAGDAITYVRSAAWRNDWQFTGGSVMVQSLDPITGTFGEPMILVEGDGNNYYPSWSPDSQWILFNRSDEDAYDDLNAQLYVVKADGSLPPIRLDDPNIGPGLTNSWARWAPFEQRLGSAQSGENFFWLTFSSKRVFGVRLPAGGQPQIWMAPFFPARAQAGEASSAPAFRLPMQDIQSNNHIAQWTEKVVQIE